MMVWSGQLDIRSPPLRPSGFPTSLSGTGLQIEHLSRHVGLEQRASGAQPAA